MSREVDLVLSGLKRADASTTDLPEMQEPGARDAIQITGYRSLWSGLPARQ